jgi:hypothetical protein
MLHNKGMQGQWSITVRELLVTICTKSLAGFRLMLKLIAMTDGKDLL